MEDGPKGYGLIGLLVAHVVCCGGLVLFASGVLTFGAIASWLGGEGFVWLAAAAAAAAAIWAWRRRRSAAAGARSPDTGAPAGAPRQR